MSIAKQPLQYKSSDRQRDLVENQRVFVDFHNADAQGRLRLNCIGTIEDLSAQKIELQSGQQLTLYSEDLEVDGVVEYSNSEHLWVVIINWDEIRQIEEVDSVQKKIFDFVEKLDEAKQDLKNVRAALSKEQEISAAVFYQQIASIFGKEEAEEIWSARSWNTNIVLRDLALVLRDEPELRQKIEQKGFNLEEIISMISQECESREFSTELPQTDQKSLARLREVICC